MIHHALGVAALATFTIDSLPSDAIALQCDGTWFELKDGEDEKLHSQSRIHIISESESYIAYWNPSDEMLRPSCDRTYLKCEIEFEPTEVRVDSQLNPAGGHFIKLSRRTGFMQYRSWSRSGSAREFLGYCKPTEMPRANTDRNIF